MTARHRLVEALEQHGCRPTPTGAARCPAHEDRAPSLSFRNGTDVAGVVVKCHSGCTPSAVMDALGLTLADLYDEPWQAAPVAPARRRVVAEYVYTDEHGEVLYVAVRYAPKDFRAKRPDGRGGYVWNLDDVPRVLYRLPEVLAAVEAGQVVHVVEGEKDADALAALGVTATCNVGGAGKWRPAYAQVLAGADVVVIADRDEPGRAHARQVADSLTGTAASVTIRQAASGKDVSDHLAAGLPLDELQPLGAPQAPAPPDAPLTDAEAVAELYPALDWHELWAQARSEPEWLCEPLLEAGRVVALFSPAKTGKSLLALEIVAALATGRPVLGNPARPPIRVLYVDLENSPDDLRERLEDLGYGPSDLGNLRYLSFPSLPVLDSMPGGAALLAVARQHDVRLVVLDTVSRIIGGDEDSADTFRGLYRHAIMPLKAEGRAVLRLDHSGKDLSRGQRGSSGKADDVDAVWSLSRRNPSTFDLRRTHSRTNHGADHLTLVRTTDPLRHALPGVGLLPSEADEVARQLSVLGVPLDAGRPTCREALNTAGIKATNANLEEAIRRRKRLPETPRAVSLEQVSRDESQIAREAPPALPEHAHGQSTGSPGSASPGYADRLPAALSPQGQGRADGAPETDGCDCLYLLEDGAHYSSCHAPAKSA